METDPLIPRPRGKSTWLWLKCCIWPYFGRKRKLSPRVIKLGQLSDEMYPPNKIRNQKYSTITFLPLVLFQQFRFFLNFYFLAMALSQFIPEIRIGYLYTYWGPLCFVISITVFREAMDDIGRYRRDRLVNNQQYDRLILEGADRGKTERVAASALRVGDVVHLHRRQRAPADLLLLRASDASGTVFVATDQLDGETDWKVRVAVPHSQKCPSERELLNINITVFAEKPQPDIHSFIGTWTGHATDHCVELDVQNTIWSGCVLESTHATGMILYTGSETRSVMNNSMPRSKVGQLDLKVNNMTKVLFVSVLLLSLVMITLKGFSGPWLRYLCRFILLFSYIIPISLRVNLEVGKSFYAWSIKKDKKIEGTVMRSTTIPEEMGRVSYLLTDKTGTVTKNEMVFKKLSLANASYDENNFDKVQTLLTQHVTKESQSVPMTPSDSVIGVNFMGGFVDGFEYPPVTARQIWDTVLAMALCHNVTPMYDKDSIDFSGTSSSWNDTDTVSSFMSESRGGAVPQQQLCDYQAASPDEVALVKWTDHMGVSLYQRDLSSISVKVRATNETMTFNILQMFPFTSETKCMGIIVQDMDTSEITYYIKGADVVLCPLVGPPDWLKQQTNLLANEGLRTLVFAKRQLSIDEYDDFKNQYNAALGSLHGRSERVEQCLASLHQGLQLLATTGVEDRLADRASMTIELLSRAGIRIWMLTGDKLETALCIAKSLKLVSPGMGQGHVFAFRQCKTRVEAHAELERLRAEGPGVSLLIGGDSLDCCLEYYNAELALLTLHCSAVVVARCSPTQKARVVCLLREHARGSICAVGDGGNDVPMIQEADIGVGLEGKEGRSAALAGDVSAREFSCLGRLLLVHGRRSRLRSSALSLFVVHRGLIISTMQAIFSTVFYLSSVSLYQGILMVGYGTIFTSIPVFSLVLDKDISSEVALLNPHLYRNLVKGRDLSNKMFCMWIGISIYQGGVIMCGALIMFEDEFIHIVAISFSALIFTELIMVALTIVTWHLFIVLAEVFSVIVYILALIILHEYFDGEFIRTFNFIWKVAVITLVSCLPLGVLKIIHNKCAGNQQKIVRR